jgi:hypothetical protein
MGNGLRIGNHLNFQLSANYNMNANDLLRWQRAFTKASEILHNATEGQLSFGTIFVNNNNIGINNAEYVLDPDIDGRALGTFGRFGELGKAIQLPAYAQRQVLSILHELGHHLWALNEEYARAASGAIDKMTALPAGHGNQIIPLLNTDIGGLPDADFAGANALLSFGGNVETRTISNKIGTQITVNSAFSQNPQNTEWTSVTVQWTAECTGDRTTGACMMEFSRSSAGEMEDNGTWTPAANPVTEFCTSFNHDPDGDTGQELSYHQSCWDTIVGRPGFTDLTAPAAGGAANTVAPAGFVGLNWVELTDQFRFALVLDHSGSMNRNGGARLQGTKTGAAYWLENAAVEGDFLSIIWFNTGNNTALNLTDFSTLTAGQIATLVTNINAQTASGGTNIRDGLIAGLNEMIRPGDLGALQASLLLTDGAHNTPAGSTMQEVLPSYQDNNANIYTLGVGSGDEMDLDGLEELSDQTGGSSFSVTDGTNVLAVQNSMIEINNLIRGGLMTAGPDPLPDMKNKDILGDFRAEASLALKRRPTLESILKKIKIKNIDDLIKKRVTGRIHVFTIEVEENADSATFTLSFEKHGRLWMYLIDPDGQEIVAGSPELVAFTSTGQPYEFAKIKRPKNGKWKVVAFKSMPGPMIMAKVIAGIQHRKLTVYATAKNVKIGVSISAGARYGELLTGLSVKAVFRNANGQLFQIQLTDENEIGEYVVIAGLPRGHYEGYVFIRSNGNTLVGNYAHAILHAKNADEIENLVVKHPSFLRQVPISFYVGESRKPVDNKEELAQIHLERFIKLKKKYENATKKNKK